MGQSQGWLRAQRVRPEGRGQAAGEENRQEERKGRRENGGKDRSLEDREERK